MAGVNVPTNTAIKEKDINTKLQLYGIYSAFSNGKAPSNKQIDVALNSALASRALSKPSPKLSQEGHVLVADLRDVIEKAKVLLLTKNDGNLLQDFIWQCQMAGTGDATKPNLPVDKETAKQHGNEALDGLRTLGTLIISNGQFRKLLNDALVLLRDIGGDAAQKAAEKINPDEEQLRQIDEPAEDNTWHDVPDLSVGQLKDQAKSAASKAKATAKSSANSAQQSAQNAAQSQGNNQDAAAAGADAAKQDFQRQADANLSQEDKDRAREQADRAQEKVDNAKQRTKDYMSEKVPKERREQTIYRLKKMIVEIQGHSDYQQAIDTLLRLAETYHGHGKDVASQSVGSAKDITEANKHVLTPLKTLIERFANSTSTDDFFDAINQVYRDADNDPELKRWFSDMDTYIRKCLKEQGYVLRDEATDEYNKLYDHGNFLLRDRYRNHTDRIVDETKFLADQFNQDAQNRAFADSMNKLFTDLGNDENGKPTFKPHLVKDLSSVIIPGIFENIRYVPIPRIEYSDPTADAIIENLVIEGDNLAPNVFEFGSDNHFRWGRKQLQSTNKNKVLVAVSGIQMDLRDVSYYVKKKQGFPSLTDTGLMDIYLGGTGFSFKMQMETADKKDQANFFKVGRVDVDIKNMKIKLKKSKYKLVFNIFKPLLFAVMKPVLAKVIEKQIRDNVHKLDTMLYEVYKDAQRAQAAIKRDPEQSSNIYKEYVSAYQRRLAAGKEEAARKKEQAKEVAKNTQVNMAVTQYDSIFKNIKLPGGTSSKATEFKELAAKGDKWESPVFSIGSAKESTNLPRPTAVTRKPHDTAPSQVRGPQNIQRDTASTSNYYGMANGGTSGPAGPSGLTMASANGSSSTTTAFSNQVNEAFQQSDKTTTTLGSHNPVLTGSV